MSTERHEAVCWGRGRCFITTFFFFFITLWIKASQKASRAPVPTASPGRGGNAATPRAATLAVTAPQLRAASQESNQTPARGQEQRGEEPGPCRRRKKHTGREAELWERVLPRAAWPSGRNAAAAGQEAALEVMAMAFPGGLQKSLPVPRAAPGAASNLQGPPAAGGVPNGWRQRGLGAGCGPRDKHGTKQKAPGTSGCSQRARRGVAGPGHPKSCVGTLGWRQGTAWGQPEVAACPGEHRAQPCQGSCPRFKLTRAQRAELGLMRSRGAEGSAAGGVRGGSCVPVPGHSSQPETAERAGARAQAEIPAALSDDTL